MTNLIINAHASRAHGLQALCARELELSALGASAKARPNSPGRAAAPRKEAKCPGACNVNVMRLRLLLLPLPLPLLLTLLLLLLRRRRLLLLCHYCDYYCDYTTSGTTTTATTPPTTTTTTTTTTTPTTTAATTTTMTTHTTPTTTAMTISSRSLCLCRRLCCRRSFFRLDSRCLRGCLSRLQSSRRLRLACESRELSERAERES